MLFTTLSLANQQLNLNTERQFQKTLYVIKLTIWAALILAGNSLIFTDQPAITIPLFMTAIFAITLRFYISKDTYNLVIGILLWWLTITCLSIAWNHQGIYDIALLSLPCVLIIAISLDRLLLFSSLLLFMIIAIIGLSFAHNTGLITAGISADTEVWPRTGRVTLILITTSIFLLAISREINQSLNSYAISERNHLKLRHKYEQAAFFDATTQLPNELMCQSKLIHQIENLNAPTEVLGFLNIKITNHSDIASNIDHSLLRAYQKEQATRLKNITNSHSSYFTLEKNQFIGISINKDRDDIERLAQQVLNTLSHPILIQGTEILTKASIGISTAPYDGRTFNELLRASQLAQHKITDKTHNSYKLYTAEMKSEFDYNSSLIKDMDQALINGEFELFYQPKLNLQDNSIEGAEALIRWNKPGAGMIPPDVFIKLAEESGHIIDIGKWVINEGIRQCKQWHNDGLKLHVAINISTIQFQKGNLPYIILQALEDHQLDPHYLEVEITESVLGDEIDSIRNQLENLASKGIELSIDDFGTSYSNLGYLSQFNINNLKIDQCFVRNSQNNLHDRHIIKAIIKLSESMKMHNTAEGIETEEDMLFLKELQCKYGQGYYWSRPLPNTEFVDFVKHYPKSTE